MNKIPIGKRLTSVCSVFAEDVPNGVSGVFLAHLLDFMKDMVWFKKAEMEDLVKALDKFIQKFDVVAAVIFTLFDVEGESRQKNNNHAIFVMISF